MLHIPNSSTVHWRYDNWGNAPSDVVGTSIDLGSANTKGSWIQVASSTNIADDVVGLQFQSVALSAVSNTRPGMIDVGIDPAGGTSYTPILNNMLVGYSPPGNSTTIGGNREYFFPIRIPKGSSVAIRGQTRWGLISVRAQCTFYGNISRPEFMPVGQYSETLGAQTSLSYGTVFTPGNAADGTWVSLGTTTKNMWWWQLMHQTDTTSITAEVTYIDLAFGDATNKRLIYRDMHTGSTSGSAGLKIQTHLLWPKAYCPVPAGSNIYVRGRCQNAPDAKYNAVVVGIG